MPRLFAILRLMPAAVFASLTSISSLRGADVSAAPPDSGFHPIAFEIEKNEKSFHYWYKPLPKDEEGFVREIRRYEMQGRILVKPVFVTASNGDSLDPLFRPIASYLALARKGDLPGILKLFDPGDLEKARKIFTPDFEKRSLAWMGSVDAFEYHLLVRDGPYVFALGYLHRDGKTSPWVDTFKCIDGAYYMSAGLPSVSTLWLEALGYVLQEQGYGAVRAAEPVPQ